MITQSTSKPVFKVVKKQPPIKSFLYHVPQESPQKNIETPKEVIENSEEDKSTVEQPVPERPKQLQHEQPIEKPISSLPIAKNDSKETNEREPILLPTPVEAPKQPPKKSTKKLDSFTQLQRLRSKLNSRVNAPTDNSYQSYQPPSVFNSSPKPVPHSVPIKDEEKEREKNTKNMGSGIAITKGDDGTCSVTQDMSVYGLSEGSSTQYFNCGESKFDKSFREHMKKVKAKLGK